MSFIVDNIDPDSLAEKIGLQANDIITSINQNPIRDFLDLQYYSAEPVLEIEWRRNNKHFSKMIQQTFEIPLGIEGKEHICKTCLNDCIFCFIDQMPPDLRCTLYVKDDDVPFSFVFGNFITLTNITEKEYQRIFKQHLSPLYISVHTTNSALHKKMMRYPLPEFSILEKLKKLAEKNIEYHTQIVLIPNYNDGEELKKTLHDLTHPDLSTLSIGIVPVGLTKYRQNLTFIEPVSKKLAKETIAIAQDFPHTYLADEFFILAGEAIPPENYYDDYPQLENGIGMIRLLLENWQEIKADFAEEIKPLQKDLVFVCGKLAAPFIEKIIKELNQKFQINVRVQTIENTFFGETVTVSGLLTAKDIFSQTQIAENEILCLPGNVFNHEGLTIDGISLAELKKQFALLLIDEEFENWEFY